MFMIKTPIPAVLGKEETASGRIDASV